MSHQGHDLNQSSNPHWLATQCMRNNTHLVQYSEKHLVHNYQNWIIIQERLDVSGIIVK